MSGERQELVGEVAQALGRKLHGLLPEPLLDKLCDELAEDIGKLFLVTECRFCGTDSDSATDCYDGFPHGFTFVLIGTPADVRSPS